MSNLTPIAPQFAAVGPTTLVFKEKKGLTLTGDSGKIHDVDGNVVFEVVAAKMTMSQRRTIKDAKGGADVGQVRKKKTPGIHATAYLGTMGDEKKCAIKSKGLMNITNCDADIYLGGTVIGEAKGNWRAKSFTISIGGNEVAKVSRKTGALGHLMDADSYHMDIVAGVDTVFISMIVIGLDEIYHDED